MQSSQECTVCSTLSFSVTDYTLRIAHCVSINTLFYCVGNQPSLDSTKQCLFCCFGHCHNIVTVLFFSVVHSICCYQVLKVYSINTAVVLSTTESLHSNGRITKTTITQTTSTMCLFQAQAYNLQTHILYTYRYSNHT